MAFSSPCTQNVCTDLSQLILTRREHASKLGGAGMIAQQVKSRSVELGTAVAIVPIDMGKVKLPVRMCGDKRLQTLKLLLNRLSLLLAGRRYSNVDCYLYHDTAPSAVRQRKSAAM